MISFDKLFGFLVDGGRATCDELQDGSYVDYQFNGWRLNFDHGRGSSSQISLHTPELMAAEWREYEEPAKLGWDFVPVYTAPKPEYKKRGRKSKIDISDWPINDINDRLPAGFTGVVEHKGWSIIKPADPSLDITPLPEGWADYG